MSKLSSKTTEWLKEAEQKYVDGMPAVTDENRKRLMQIGLDAVRDELKLRAQKKSDQPTGKTGQLPEPAMTGYIPTVERDLKNQVTDQEQNEKAFENKGWEKVREALPVMAKAYDEFIQAPIVAPKPTAIIHFAGQQYPGQYTRGELWSDVRQNFKLVLLSATFRRCLSSGDYSELWSMVLFVKLWQGIHEGLKKLEGGKEYTMEELLIRHWVYGDGMKVAGQALARYLNQPKPQQ
jgi:hypothetical protein